MRVPVGGAQPGEGRHQHHPAAVGHARRQRLDLGRTLYQPEAVAQPLHHRAAHEHAALERIARRRLDAGPAHRGEQPVGRGHRRMAGVHEQKAAGAVGVLRHARGEAGLAEGRRLLVAADARDRDRSPEQRRIGLSAHPAAGHHARQQGGRDAEALEQHRVPVHRVQVEEQRARGVAGVGHMQPAAAQVPHQPAVDGAEGELAALGAGARIGDVVEQPGELGGREVRIELQTGAHAHVLGPARGAQALALGRGAAVLPDDRGGERTPAGTLPQHGGLALVGDADGRHLACGHPGVGERLAGAIELGAQDVLGVVLDAVGRREVLRERLLGEAAHTTAGVEHDRARAGGALVEGEQVGHGDSARGLTGMP